MKFMTKKKVVRDLVKGDKIGMIGKIILLIDVFYKVVVRKLVYLGVVVAHIAEIGIAPPEKYPYLYSLIYAMLGFVGFSFIFLQSNLFMINEFN